jgi:hypothetical protein
MTKKSPLYRRQWVILEGKVVGFKYLHNTSITSAPRIKNGYLPPPSLHEECFA